ncbi:MAG: XisI protein [Dolichospermum sp. DET50]|nr:XisI protein [Dolichospermum sp. DET66]MBS3032823.1 XisI protein [Dolichospermum sp. DET67]MBS3038029.1 XisI protein [Dolichospermum sp. DET50]QSX70619.1 MAG: XisI protein [Dolichospermum sp. DET69]
MEKLDYPELVQQVLGTHTDGHCSEGTEIELIFDIQRNRYLVVHIGWEGENRTSIFLILNIYPFQGE